MSIPVLIPSYNEANQMAPLIESLRGQTIEVEPIVIDNDSDDGTGRIATELGATVLHEKNPGQFPALQEGLRRVGIQELILVTDADTTHPPTWAETMRKYQEQVIVPTVLTGNIDFIYPKNIEGQVLRIARIAYRAGRQRMRSMAGLRTRIYGPNIALANIDELVMEELLYYPPFRRGNDLAIGSAFLAKGGDVKFIKDRTAKVFSSGDRYPTIASAAKYLLNRGDSAYGDREERDFGLLDFTVAQYDSII